jgi:hypothetical protein
MPQLNIHLTPEFEQTLSEYMRLRGLRTKSDAVRLAIQEAVDRERRLRRVPDFTRWLGLGKQVAENPHPKFHSDDELWG